MIFSQVRRIMPGNWSIIQPSSITPVEGAWRFRQNGVGADSELIFERYQSGIWVEKFTISG